MEPHKILNINLLNLFGLTNASDQNKDAFFRDMEMFVLSRVVMRLRERFSPAQQEEFTRLFEQDAPEDQRQIFLEAHAPNIEELIMREGLILKQEMRRAAQESAATPARKPADAAL